MKWSAPSFTDRGRILCGMAAFKQHASFGLWLGDLVVGSEGRNPGDGMGQFGRLTRLADLPGKRELAAYIRRAAKLIEEGTRPAATNREPRPVAQVPDDLLAALGKNAGARAASMPSRPARSGNTWNGSPRPSARKPG